MKKYLIWVYVAGVLVILAIINLFIVSRNMVTFSGGFLVGMLAMYVAVHFYKDKK